MDSKEDEEFREREARRLNLVIHGIPEISDNIKVARERMEKDVERCEDVFMAMGARPRRQQIRFCRRIGERGPDPRPVVIGLYEEEVKRHLLEKAKELRNTAFNNITIVPDLTKTQRRGEQKLREEADKRNRELTQEDRDRNLKWLVVGKRGEKRLIKGQEREDRGGRIERPTWSTTGNNCTNSTENNSSNGNGNNIYNNNNAGIVNVNSDARNRVDSWPLLPSTERNSRDWRPPPTQQDMRKRESGGGARTGAADRPWNETGTRRRDGGVWRNQENSLVRDWDRPASQQANTHEVEQQQRTEPGADSRPARAWLNSKRSRTNSHGESNDWPPTQRSRC